MDGLKRISKGCNVKGMCIITICEICLGTYVMMLAMCMRQPAVSDCLWPESLGETNQWAFGGESWELMTS